MPRGRQGENNEGLRCVDPRRFDTLFGLLADRDRRTVLRWFRDHDDETVSLRTLSRHLAGERDAQDVDRVTLGLHHWVLPKLQEAGVVEYDARSETVRYRREPDVETLLERLDRWTRNR